MVITIIILILNLIQCLYHALYLQKCSFRSRHYFDYCGHGSLNSHDGSIHLPIIRANVG